MNKIKKRMWDAKNAAGALLAATLMMAFLAGCTSSSSSDTTESAQVAVSSAAGAVAGTDTTSPTASSVPEVPVPPAATTPVPAPSGGDINQTVAEAPITTLPAAQVTETADLGGGVNVEVQDVKSVTGTARGPGEIGGPAAAVTVQITNNSSADIALNEVQVTAEDNAGNPASPISGDPAAPMSGELKAGESATGVFVFYLGQSHQNPLKISISYSAGAPVALYTADI